MAIRERSGMWHYRFTVNGNEYSGSTDLAATERNRAAAQRIEAKAHSLVVSGRAHELRMEVIPFNEAAEQYLSWCDGEYREHPNSAKRIRTSFASLSSHFGRAAVSSITAGAIERYKTWRRTDHEIKEVTLRHDLHALSGFFQFAEKHGWCRENPVEKIEIPSDQDAVRMHVLTATEETLYFATAEMLSQPRTIERKANRRQRAHSEVIATDYSDLIDVARVMIEQGCRPDEVISLRVSDVDLESGHLFIRHGKSKAARRRLLMTARSREIFARRVSASAEEPQSLTAVAVGQKISGPAEIVLQSGNVSRKALAPGQRKVRQSRVDSLKGAAPLTARHIFPSSRVPGQHIAIPQAAHDRVLKQSGLSFVLYDLRHTFATRRAEAGCPPATLAAILGHGDLRSISKYVHVRPEALDAEMRREPSLSEIRPSQGTKTGENAVSQVTKREVVN